MNFKNYAMFKFFLSFILYFFSFLYPLAIHAQNPVLQPGFYLADPSPHVWNHVLYLYGSKDESPSYYCSSSYDVYWTDDMINWHHKENIFSISDIPSLKGVKLYAPDCIFHKGKYYLYFGLSNNQVGVAESDNPIGPFKFLNIINLYGFSQIDPSVFIDDDGSAYLVWGQFHAKVAKLKENMTEIDSATIHNDVINEEKHYFHEGAHIVKYNGLYYFIYADIERKNMPTCLGYSVSKSLFGPYTYMGVIVDNDHCDPGNWNNHGNIIKFNGEWYIFYHRSTDSSFSLRKTCIEHIDFQLDGSIPEVQMTSNGVLNFLDPYVPIFPQSICLLFGQARIHFNGQFNSLDHIGNNDRVLIRYLNFGHPTDSLFLNISSSKSRGHIAIIPDQPWLAPIGTISINSDLPAARFYTIKTKIQSLQGVHGIWLRFQLNADNDLKIRSLQFK